MDIEQLKSRGAIVKAGLTPVEVTWRHEDEETGEEVSDTFTVFVKRLSVGWLERAFTEVARNPNLSRSAAIISEGVRFGENGVEKLSYEEANQLHYGLARVLTSAFDKINQPKEVADTKNSEPPMSSGTSSSSTESAAAQ